MAAQVGRAHSLVAQVHSPEAQVHFPVVQLHSPVPFSPVEALAVLELQEAALEAMLEVPWEAACGAN